MIKRHVFGKKSEKLPSVKQQLRVGGGKNSPAAHEKRRQNAAARENLPERLIHHAVLEAQRKCPRCGGTNLRSLGEGKTSVIIDYVPPKIERQIHVRETLACRCGEGVVTAEGPAKVIDGGHYGPGFVAHAVVAKCADSIPLYRLEKIYGRHGAPIARSTLIEQFHAAAQLTNPIAKRILDKVASSPVVNADETSIRVQAPDKTRTGYLWTFVSDRLIAYQFSPSRSGETPSRVLGDSAGALVVDAYTGYNQVTRPGLRERIGCWAHGRRKIFDASETAPEAAKVGLDLITELYRVEHDAIDAGIAGTDEHRKMRAERSSIIIDSQRRW